MTYEPSFLRDGIILGVYFVTLLLLGVHIGWHLARRRFLREGQAQGAASQRARSGSYVVVSPKAPTANWRN